MANNVLFKTSLIKGPQGDRGEAGEADAVPVDGVLVYEGTTIPEGYEETGAPSFISDLYNDLDSRIDANADEIALQTARIDDIASLPSGSTSGDAELADIRIAWDGTSYNTAGNAVRGQIENCLKTAKTYNGTIDCNNQTNGVKLFNVEATLQNGPSSSTFNDWQDGGLWMLETYNTSGLTWQTIQKCTLDVNLRKCYRQKVGSTWGAWTVLENIPYYTVYKTFNGTVDCNAQKNNVVLFNVNTTLQNGPSNFTDWQTDAGMWMLETYTTTTIAWQIMQKATFDVTYRKCYRLYNNGSWGAWTTLDATPFFTVNKTFNGTIDCNSQKNDIVLFNVNGTLQNGPSNFTDWQDGSIWTLVTYNAKDAGGVSYIFQGIYKLSNEKTARTAVRIKINNNWSDWSIYGAVNSEIHVGPGRQYTRLRDGIAVAVSRGNTKVYVHPGTYDLISEFSDEIQAATGDTGIELKNNIHVFFYTGAKVTALFDNSQGTYDSTTWRWIYDHFQPFYCAPYSTSTDYILENLEIEASNTRYCVHDEKAAQNVYRHEYKNCKMKYYTDHQDMTYVACIGGGLGDNGTIIIDGGTYETYSEYGSASIDSGNKDSIQQCISYHNGNNNAGYSTITIKNVYLKDRGYFRFGWYGNSTAVSHVQIDGCSTGLPTLLRYETSGISTPKNMDLTEFCNELRNPSHWTLDSNYYVATLVSDE